MASKNGASVLEKVITRDDLAQLLVMSDRNVSRLTKMGVLRQAKGKSGYVLGDAVPRFVEHLRDQIADDDPHEALYRSARARKMEALACSEEMRVKLQKGELLERSRVVNTVAPWLVAMKNHLLSLASRITRQLLPHVAAETGNENFRAIYETVNGEVRRALTEVSEFDAEQIATAAHRKRTRQRLKQKFGLSRNNRVDAADD
jgi:hypothetical protein